MFFNSLTFLFIGFLVACSTPTVSSDDSDEIELTSSSKSSSSSKKETSSSSDKKVSSSSERVESSSASKETSSSSEKITSSDKSSSSNKSFSSSSEQIELSSSDEKSSSSVAIKSIYEAVEESGLYTTRDSVAAYLCKFDKLPSNYVGKNEGKSLYESKIGKTFDKWNFNPWTTIGVMIGGDTFNNYADNPDNYHPTLPEGNYHEADVDYSAKNRGTKRLIYQSDCVIYYTADHYETFNKLEVKVP